VAGAGARSAGLETAAAELGSRTALIVSRKPVSGVRLVTLATFLDEHHVDVFERRLHRLEAGGTSPGAERMRTRLLPRRGGLRDLPGALQLTQIRRRDRAFEDLTAQRPRASDGVIDATSLPLRIAAKRGHSTATSSTMCVESTTVRSAASSAMQVGRSAGALRDRVPRWARRR
jgi:hypothetical protein